MYIPKISIIIPAYNASNYLAEAIESALSQTYSNMEIIVVNDGSKDGGETEKIALSYGDKIRYFCKENGGSSSALNIGITNMTGEWFSWLSHDDLYVPEKLECQVEYMRSLLVEEADLPNHVFFSASELIDANAKRIKTNSRRQAIAMEKKLDNIPHNGYLIAEPTIHNFYGCSCLVHKDILLQMEGFDEDLRLLNDMDLWYRIYAANCKIHYIPKPLVKARIHSKQISRMVNFNYHNSEQDMFWNRSLEWLITNYPSDEKLFFLFGRNAYLKTRNAEGDKAFDNIKSRAIRKFILKNIYKCRANVRHRAKELYLTLRT